MERRHSIGWLAKLQFPAGRWLPSTRAAHRSRASVPPGGYRIPISEGVTCYPGCSASHETMEKLFGRGDSFQGIVGWDTYLLLRGRIPNFLASLRTQYGCVYVYTSRL